MPSEDGKNDPGDKTEANPQEKQLKDARRLLPTRVVGVYILGTLAVAFGGYGADLLNAQFFYCGWSFVFAGAFCGLIAARFWIINHRTKHPMPGWLDSNWTFAGFLVICAIACFSAAVFSSIKPNSHDDQSDLAKSHILTQRAMTSISADLRAGFHVDFVGMSPDHAKIPQLNYIFATLPNVKVRITSMDDGPVRLGKQIISVFENGGFRVAINNEILPDPEQEGVTVNYPLDYASSADFQKALKRLFQELDQRPQIIVGTNAVGKWLGTDARVIFVTIGKCPP